LSSSSTSKKWIVGLWDGKAFTFKPQSEYDHNLVAHLKVGTRVRLDVTEFRSLPRNSYYWVILQVVVDNSECFATKESLHKTLLLACGVVEPIVDLDGEITMAPASTAFDKMPEGEFKAYFDKAMGLISTKIIPGMDLQELLKEADRHSAGTRKPYHPK
jgi:hypothetical protein